LSVDTFGQLVDKLSIVTMKLGHTPDSDPVTRKELWRQWGLLLTEMLDLSERMVRGGELTRQELVRPACKVDPPPEAAVQEAKSLAHGAELLGRKNDEMWHDTEMFRRARDADCDELRERCYSNVVRNQERTLLVDRLDELFVEQPL
jgi:hypothetical protein